MITSAEFDLKSEIEALYEYLKRYSYVARNQTSQWGMVGHRQQVFHDRAKVADLCRKVGNYEKTSKESSLAFKTVVMVLRGWVEDLYTKQAKERLTSIVDQFEAQNEG